MQPRRVIILGAAGRDFHNFNRLFRGNPVYKVVAFTAAQIPNIEGRRYPAALAGDGYPQGIPIYRESDLPVLISKLKADEVLFSYSDVSYDHLMHLASIALAAGADFRLAGPNETMLKASKPVIAVTAVRTGCGKSQTTRRVAQLLTQAGFKVVIVRHPMPYGDLVKQRVQRFQTLDDLKKHQCTIEEMEEYEPHLARGNVVFAGVDYEAILREVEKEAEIILWDGGNNDLPFYQPDFHITVVDPLRPGDEVGYYPGEVNLIRADAVVVNKIDSAIPEDVAEVRENVHHANPKAVVIEAASPVSVDKPDLIHGKRALVVEDGPTLTHGEMDYGAGVVAARKFGAADLIDPRPWAVGSIAETFQNYPDIGTLLPAMGYGAKQVKDLERTINAADAEVVVIGTPIDLRRVIRINKPTVRVTYELQEIGKPDLTEALAGFIRRSRLNRKH